MFVRALAGEWGLVGIGKQIERRDHVCTVEYFDAPMADPIRVELLAANIASATIPEQTRVYYYNPAIGAWEIGRLLDDHGDSQLVQFPNKITRLLSVSDIFVRWSKPIADPTPYLANRINESPRFSDGRSAFTRSQMDQRAASLGLSSILSSAIELENHQVEVVRRILQDPVQRYLLADEVGLGKTIEAGILIRQCVLDCGDDVLIVVIVPETIVHQWHDELTVKFHLQALLGQQIRIVATTAIAENRALLERADMLVIDEAHHLTNEVVDAATYDAIAAAAPHIERVLLLSATPVLHNERGFLAMLHLLDADTYPLNGIEAFRDRIRSRQALAEIVAGLVPENALYLDYTIETLATLYPEDLLLQSHVTRLREVIDTMPAEDDPLLVEAISRTRAHLSEVYRLHRRILRHRRRNVIGLTPDRAGAEIHQYASSDRSALTQAIDDWRFDEALALTGQDVDAWKPRHAAFRQVLDRAAQYASDGSGMVGFLARRSEMVGDPAGFAPIPKVLGRSGLFEDRAEALLKVLKNLLAKRCKCVVFCSDPKTADALAVRLRFALARPVDRHDPNSDNWSRFNDDPDHSVLICDRRAEEGLNLQGGHKVVVHYDTPFNPNRLEQRLGRVDRYGSGQAVRSVLLVCEDDPLEQAWTRYLTGALKLFDRSVASLQYLLDEMARDLAPALFSDGPDALEALIRVHGGDDGIIEKEIKAIDQQDALDALGTPPSDLVDNLCDIDDTWREIAADTTLWLEQTLMFERVWAAPPDSADRCAVPFRYRYATGRTHTLLPLSTFLAACKGSVDLTPHPGLGRVIKTVPYTFHRRTALSKSGRALGTRLLRYGEPLLTGIGEITGADDRGRSFALWREDPAYSASQAADVFLRFDFLVQVDLEAVLQELASFNNDSVAARAALRRRGDLALAPSFSTIWLDSSLAPVGAGALKALLERPYCPRPGNGYRDINVNARRWRRLERLEIDEVGHWADHCSRGRIAAEQLLRGNADLLERLRLAERQVAEIDSGRLGQLEVRLRQNPTGGDQQLALERALAGALREGIRTPSVRLETIGSVFLTGSAAATDRLSGGS